MKLYVKLLVLFSIHRNVGEVSAFMTPSKIVRPSPLTRLGVAEMNRVRKTKTESRPFRERKEIEILAPPIIETITETPVITKTAIDIKKKTQVREQTQTETKSRTGFMAAVKVHGTSLRSCSFGESVTRAHVFLKTDGRPMKARVELWHGPENPPQTVSVDVEDGSIRPFSCIIETPGDSNAIAIRNVGGIELPLYACIEALVEKTGPIEEIGQRMRGRIVQGGAVYSVPCPANVATVQLMLHTHGGPLSARIEVLQGPNNSKQTMNVFSEEGLDRPFFVVVDTPGSGHLIRIVNTANMEYPLTARVDPYVVDVPVANGDPGMKWS
uniref:Uncharacterized protein n=1 Tax=Ditylum brightwellii TaxID=49249 RepID=A0A6U3WKK6_9STRA|mmetsp:Transcript_54848/g.81626  ORF Transcript_54848/g.81626 Transcript_54848/m.81626 type:complete len:326 (+) Transcript_54848:118-1095(+)